MCFILMIAALRALRHEGSGEEEDDLVVRKSYLQGAKTTKNADKMK